MTAQAGDNGFSKHIQIATAPWVRKVRLKRHKEVAGP